jgi:hypothetical protein
VACVGEQARETAASGARLSSWSVDVIIPFCQVPCGVVCVETMVSHASRGMWRLSGLWPSHGPPGHVISASGVGYHMAPFQGMCLVLTPVGRRPDSTCQVCCSATAEYPSIHCCYIPFLHGVPVCTAACRPAHPRLPNAAPSSAAAVGWEAGKQDRVLHAAA